MASFNNVTLVGRLVQDPELKSTTTGKSICSFALAVDKGFGKEGADFIDCEAWNQTADFIGKYLTKGSRILANGRLNQQTWEKDGQKKSRIVVTVKEVLSLSSASPREEESANQEVVSETDIPF